MKHLINKGLIALLLIVGVLSCKKNNEWVDQDYQAPPTAARFISKDTTGLFYIQNASSTFKIPVGVTTVSDQPRTINITYSSPTGAAQGAQFNAPTSITIPAGKAVDTLVISGLFANYSSTRIDTLRISISGAVSGSVPANAYYTTFRLVMRKVCPVTLSSFLGTYNNTIETLGTGSPYGPYTTAVSAVNQLTSTTGTITVTNIWDNGWGPITFTLDWTDPVNTTITPVAQTAIPGSNAGDLNAQYTGQTVAVRTFTGQLGTISACEGKLILRMQLGVTGVGFFNSLYTVTLSR